MIEVKTANFNPEIDLKLKCTCGNPLCDRRSVGQATLNKVQLVRDDLGIPMQITSGGRCQHHLSEVSKSRPGDHQLCIAVDVYYESETMKNKLMVLAGRHGATAVAAGKNFVHMAWRDTEDRSVPTWTY